MENSISVDVSNYSLWYGNFQALISVSAQFKRGIITGLIGPSGCGKTTLLRSFNRINERYGNDLTVLMWAAGYSDEAGTKDMEKVITILLDRGARLDDQDNRGRTPLMIAAELNHTVAIDLLLARGADKTLRDKEGKSAADLTSLTALREKLAATH